MTLTLHTNPVLEDVTLRVSEPGAEGGYSDAIEEENVLVVSGATARLGATVRHAASCEVVHDDDVVATDADVSDRTVDLVFTPDTSGDVALVCTGINGEEAASEAGTLDTLRVTSAPLDQLVEPGGQDVSLTWQGLHLDEMLDAVSGNTCTFTSNPVVGGGAFNEGGATYTFTPSPGLTTVTLSCTDRFGNTYMDEVEVSAMSGDITSPTDGALLPYGTDTNVDFAVTGATSCQVKADGTVVGMPTGASGSVPVPVMGTTVLTLECQAAMNSAFYEMAAPITVYPQVQIDSFELVWREDSPLAPLWLAWSAEPSGETSCAIAGDDTADTDDAMATGGGAGDMFLPGMNSDGGPSRWSFLLTCTGPGTANQAVSTNIDVWRGDADTATYTGSDTLAGIEAVEGSVSLESSISTNDLANLAGVRFITGDFYVSTMGTLTDLEGTASLEHVGGTFTLTNNNALVDVASGDFPGLVSVGGLSITNNDVLATVNFSALTTVGDSITVQGNDVLATVNF
ncbi:MAG: hypothetical protein D6701_04510, partial [Gemmatimonadetes bacterium]